MAEYIEHSAVIGLLRRYNGDIVVREIERLPITEIDRNNGFFTENH